jgi:hypothetical protein
MPLHTALKNPPYWADQAPGNCLLVLEGERRAGGLSLDFDSLKTMLEDSWSHGVYSTAKEELTTVFS